MEEDPDIAAAIRMSMAGLGDMDEDEELQRALQLSMQTAQEDLAREGSVEKMEEEKPEVKAEPEVKTEGEAQKMEEDVDSDYMKEVLMALPGVDPTDPEFQVFFFLPSTCHLRLLNCFNCG